MTADNPATARPSRSLVLALGAAVLLLAAAGYAWTGSPRVPGAAPPTATASAAPAAPDDAAREFAAAAQELAEQLKDQPGNAEGWATLARAYVRLGRIDSALPAFAQAVALQDKDASLLADYAAALIAAGPRNVQDDEPRRWIEAALQIDPDNAKALALAGRAALFRKDFAGAVRHWERLRQVLPGDSALMAPLQTAIQQARAQGALGDVSPASTDRGLRGRVRLSPALAALAAPDDTVFIFARPATGPRQPLAVVRRQVKDLPLDFHLDDSAAMSPATRLSLHPQVVVGARISKRGQATPQAGDLAGQSSPVANDTQDVLIEIGDVVRN